MNGRLKLLSGGAAQGLVSCLGKAFQDQRGFTIEGAFGAVGEMKDRLLAGEITDVVILTARIVGELAGQGLVVGHEARELGAVDTALAVRAGDPAPPVDDGDRLRDALLASDAIYIPDPERATAGIHFAAVLDRLGVAGEVRDRLRPFPNGATAMRELAQARGRRPIGCTQITEILANPGVQAIGSLPPPFGLSTVYTAAPCRDAAEPEAARALARLLASPEAASARRLAGFGEVGVASSGA